ncbi:MAG: metal-sensitive transcriptional regulator [Flaviflexus sp.]|uniref:metal-sensitive transcriptional regulator n=1 Tax=Flaviflexus sp. TaxID=1969482 RepID=UPI00352F7E4E
MDMNDAEAQKKILNRLKRARGQLDAVINAVDEGGSCRDVITQLAAVTHALNRAGFLVISNAMENCIEDPEAAEENDGVTTQELEKLFLALA